MYTNRSGVYMRQVSTRARYGRTANESRSEAGMPLLDESLHRACTGSRLEPGSTQPLEPGSTRPLGVVGLREEKEKQKTKMRHKEQTSAQPSLESGNEKKKNETKPAHE